MSISSYLNKLRASDEKTKHKSAMTIAIIASVVVLSFAFLFLKDSLFNFNKSEETEQVVENIEPENKLESPMTSFLNFFKETGSQFSSLKSAISGAFSGENTSTSSID